MYTASLKTKIVALFLSFTLLASTTSLAFAEAEEGKRLQRRISERRAEQPAMGHVIPGHLYIPAHTTFEVELTKELHSKKNKENEIVDLRMVDNLIINGIVIIPKGTIGKGIITEARKAGGFGRKGKLTMQPQWIKTINSIEVPLSNELQSTGQSDGGAVAVAAVVSLVGGAFMKGTNAIYPAGTKFVVEVKNNVDLGDTEENLALFDVNKPQGKELRVHTGN